MGAEIARWLGRHVAKPILAGAGAVVAVASYARCNLREDPRTSRQRAEFTV